MGEPPRESGGSLAPILLHQSSDTLGSLSAAGQPVLGTLQVDLELRLAGRRDGVEETQSLDVPPIAPIATVGHDDVIEGAVLRTAARKANRHHSLRGSLFTKT